MCIKRATGKRALLLEVGLADGVSALSSPFFS